MGGIESKNIDSPDESRQFDKGQVQLVTLGGVTFGRATFQPGWKWSECIKPIVKTDSCQVHHTTFLVSGQLHVRMNDGSEQVLKAGDVAIIPPGHDAWVEGNEPAIGIDIDESAKEYAKPV